MPSLKVTTLISRIVSLRAGVRIKRIRMTENGRIVCKPVGSSQRMNICISVCIRLFLDTGTKGLTSKSSCCSGKDNR